MSEMTKYTAVQVVTLHAGKVKLTKEQAGPRMHCLEDDKGGVYNILKPIQFKVGEEFGYDGEVTKDFSAEPEKPKPVKKVVKKEAE